jgi:hypothetical protein
MTPTFHQVTNWEPPSVPVETASGVMPYATWLLYESRRWGAKGRSLEIRTNEKGDVAAFAASRNNYQYVEMDHED